MCHSLVTSICWCLKLLISPQLSPKKTSAGWTPAIFFHFSLHFYHGFPLSSPLRPGSSQGTNPTPWASRPPRWTPCWAPCAPGRAACCWPRNRPWRAAPGSAGAWKTWPWAADGPGKVVNPWKKRGKTWEKSGEMGKTIGKNSMKIVEIQWQKITWNNYLSIEWRW